MNNSLARRIAHGPAVRALLVACAVVGMVLSTVKHIIHPPDGDTILLSEDECNTGGSEFPRVNINYLTWTRFEGRC